MHFMRFGNAGVKLRLFIWGRRTVGGVVGSQLVVRGRHTAELSEYPVEL